MTPEKTATAEIVCLVDDDPAVLKSVSRLLASDGFSVRTFNEPDDFLVYIQAHRVPVAIIDVWMPAMNGLEVQSRLRKTSPSTRVIIFTGKEDALVRSAALKAGASAFFIKPFGDEDFLAAVRRALALFSKLAPTEL